MHSGLQSAFCFGGHSSSLLVERNCDPAFFLGNTAIDAAWA